MGRQVIEIKVGRNTGKGTVGIKFPHPTLMLEMAAMDAVNLAIEIVRNARECAKTAELKNVLKDMGKEIQ